MRCLATGSMSYEGHWVIWWLVDAVPGLSYPYRRYRQTEISFRPRPSSRHNDMYNTRGGRFGLYRFEFGWGLESFIQIVFYNPYPRHWC